MQVLVLCDDYWHPARVPREGLGGLDGDEFQLDWIENAHEWSAERMARSPVVILTKSNNISASDRNGWMTPEVEAAFADYIRRGNGLVAIHSGTAEYEQTPLLRGLLGGVFSHHPDQCPVTMLPQSGHPLTAGCETFTLQDEHYFMLFDDRQADVYMTTKSEHGEQPGAWTRTEGKGRVAVLTPGHNLEVWLHPSFQALLRNALFWCARRF